MRSTTVTISSGTLYPNDVDDLSGIHTHGDGLIHIHPFHTGVTGQFATVGAFMGEIEFELNDSRFELPDGTILDESGEGCASPDPDNDDPDISEPGAELRIMRWETLQAEKALAFAEDLREVRFLGDGQIFVFAYVHPSLENADVPRPDDAFLRAYLNLPSEDQPLTDGSIEEGPVLDDGGESEPVEGDLPVTSEPTETVEPGTDENSMGGEPAAATTLRASTGGLRMKAILLLGGLGTRLRPLTNDTPKQMLPVCGRPMIEWVCEHLSQHGVNEVVLSLGYRAEAFTEAYPQGRIGRLAYKVAVEPEPRGTAGAVRFAAEASGITESFLVLNGDVLTDLDVGALARFHASSGAEATIALQPVADPTPYGLVVADPEGRVMSFSEKPEPGVTRTALPAWRTAHHQRRHLRADPSRARSHPPRSACLHRTGGLRAARRRRDAGGAGLRYLLARHGHAPAVSGCQSRHPRRPACRCPGGRRRHGGVCWHPSRSAHPDVGHRPRMRNRTRRRRAAIHSGERLPRRRWRRRDRLGARPGRRRRRRGNALRVLDGGQRRASGPWR